MSLALHRIGILSSALSSDLHQVLKLLRSGTSWTSPADIVGKLNVKTWGAAGGGNQPEDQGGGGGAFAEDDVAVAQSTAYGYSIGTGGSADGTDDGGDTNWNSGAVIAKGGQAANNGGAGGSAASSTGSIKYDGGARAASNGGASAGSEGAASGTTPGNPQGVTSETIPGGGGNGSGTTNATAGANGQILLTYKVPPTEGYPFVRDRAGARSNSATSHVVAIPANRKAGDRLVVIVGVRDSATIAEQTTSNWTKLGQNEPVAANITTAVFRRVATGDSNDDLTVTSGAVSAGWSSQAYAIGNGGTPEVTFDDGASGSPNPPSHSPAGGSAAYLWIAAVQTRAHSDIDGGPGGYESLWLQPGPTFSSCGSASAVKQATAASDNPTAFNAISGTQDWNSATISVPLAA